MKIPCPNCGSTELARVVRALVLRPVADFAVTKDTLSAAKVAHENWVDADSVEAVDYPWRCLACTREHNDEALLQEAVKWI